jgi:hypothetical protein
MRQWKLESRSLAAFLLIGLVGCAANNPTIQSAKVVYPDIPDVPTLPALDLKPVKLGFPTPDMFVAFDYDNWLNMATNMQTLKQRELLYQQRINEVNLQRAEWRKINQSNSTAK